MKCTLLLLASWVVLPPPHLSLGGVVPRIPLWLEKPAEFPPCVGVGDRGRLAPPSPPPSHLPAGPPLGLRHLPHRILLETVRPDPLSPRGPAGGRRSGLGRFAGYGIQPGHRGRRAIAGLPSPYPAAHFWRGPSPATNMGPPLAPAAPNMAPAPVIFCLSVSRRRARRGCESWLATAARLPPLGRPAGRLQGRGQGGGAAGPGGRGDRGAVRGPGRGSWWSGPRTRQPPPGPACPHMGRGGGVGPGAEGTGPRGRGARTGPM
jgi:hypothetical protein